MSTQALADVINRAIGDAAFRRQLATDPATALKGYELSSRESEAVRSRDAGRLSALGVDERMSKAFAISGATLSSGGLGSAISVGDEAAPNAVQRFELEGAGAAGNAITAGDAALGDVTVSDDATLNAVQRFELEGAGAADNGIDGVSDGAGGGPAISH